MKLTRRQLVTVLAPAAALAQTTPQSPSAGPNEELRAARERIKTNGEALAQSQVPMATEPAFQFKA